MFRSLLIANRGEIAVRVLRTARTLGLRTIAVYSDADRDAAHVRVADEAVAIGGATPAESYLHAQSLLEAARRTGAEAIHPGYGFLSEDAAFAAAVTNCGLVFVGPGPETLELAGEKTAARRTVAKAGVPVVPGSDGAVRDATEAARLARDVGLPVLLKPAGGGGGKGMRIVREREDLERQFQAASREAEKAFGNPALYVERHLGRVRHLEVQILGTGRGVVAVGERECSIQRRYQKVLEETPSPVTHGAAAAIALRARLLKLAVMVGEAVHYRNAGTVEFLLDEDGELYFIEINARLQVEHPVTELVTGLDLVEAQLRIASGQELSPAFSDVQPKGWALECRVCAEDPERDFLPATGVVRHLRVPAGPGIRWDGGIQEGSSVTAHYDSLLGKLAAWGHDREQALARLSAALEELRIEGLTTNLAFLGRVLRDEAFRRGDLHTSFLQERRPFLRAGSPPHAEEIAAVIAIELERRKALGLGSAAAATSAPGSAKSSASSPNGAHSPAPSSWRTERLPFVWIGR